MRTNTPVLRIAQLVAAALALALALALGLAGRTTAAPPNSGPGGPILVITDSSNPFTAYYAEILRAEGLNEFDLADISTVTAATLASHDVAILGDLTPTGNQVTMLTAWVNGGGNLIAMRPGQELAPLLGLSGAGTTLPNGYLKVDTSRAPGTGIVDQTIQYHGDADRWAPSDGTRKVATLFTGAGAAAETPNPAVTVRDVGPNGGQAAAFTFDLARSIVLTRQGNLAWEGQERDGFLDAGGNTGPVRPNDMFFGNAVNDPQPDWLDFSKIAIPQADEQQRLLANLIGDVTADRKPLPRFWYLPRDAKAAVVMTGDDHGNGGTAGRFDSFRAASPPGCNVAAWECIRGTSYIYPSTPSLGDAQASGYVADGFEIALHLTTGCADFDAASLETLLSQQLADLKARYPSLPAPVTNRTHCIPFSDWATEPKIEAAHGIRLDTNYYYWPASWIGDRPGFFTGSGMPMRFGDSDGSMIDVYQAVTQMTDESGQSYPGTINALLDRAVGAEGYYGVFTANIHTDVVASDAADAIVASAKARGVPVVSARQMLTWLDGRNDSSFGSIAWSGSQLSFTVNPGAGATGLRGMLPVAANGGSIATVTRDGSAVAITPQRIKGVDYAFFDAGSGSYVATYVGTRTTRSAAPSAVPSKSAATIACLKITANTKRIVRGRRTRLTVTTRKSGRPVARVRVGVSGAGLKLRTRRTDRKGHARFVVRPRRTGSLRVRSSGQPASCRKKATATVAVVKKKAKKKTRRPGASRP
jgi:hypothetical protein